MYGKGLGDGWTSLRVRVRERISDRVTLLSTTDVLSVIIRQPEVVSPAAKNLIDSI